MLKEEEIAEIRRLRTVDHLSIRAIARRVSRHYSSVRRVLLNEGIKEKRDSNTVENHLLAPMLSFIEEKLMIHPNMPKTRLREILKDKGIEVSVHQLRRFLRGHKFEKPKKAFMRVSLVQGEQAQIDWASCGKILIDGSARKLSLFAMVLGYSRMIYARFYVDQSMGSFLSAHLHAFEYFGGVPDKLLYDNLKTAVVSHVGPIITFNSELLRFASKLHCALDACNPRSGWEKGRVERSIRYIKESFLGDREFSDLESANRELLTWLNETANKRPWPQGRHKSVEEVWRDIEKPILRPETLSKEPFFHETVVRVGKTPYVRFDCNDYSVPATFVKESLVVFASEDTVKIYHGIKEVACHQRSYARGKTIESREHIDDLLKTRASALSQTRRRLFHESVPLAVDFLKRVSDKQENVAYAKTRLYRLLERYSVFDLNNALESAIKEDRCSIVAVELMLRHHVDETRELDLSSYPDLKLHQITPHNLEKYHFNNQGDSLE